MKTRDEVQELKHDWEVDPCWDIEDTEGFEEYRDELEKHRLDMEILWTQEYQFKVFGKMDALGIDSFKLAEYILKLETRLDELERIVSER